MKNKCVYILLFFVIVFVRNSNAQQLERDVYQEKINNAWKNNQADSALFFYEHFLEGINLKKETEKYIQTQKERLKVAYIIGDAKVIESSVEELLSLKLHPKKDVNLIYQIKYQEAKYQYWKGYYKKAVELFETIPTHKDFKLYHLADRYVKAKKENTEFLKRTSFEDNLFETASEQTYFLSQLFELYGMPKDALAFSQKSIDYLSKEANKLEAVMLKIQYAQILLSDLYKINESKDVLEQIENVVNKHALETTLELDFLKLELSKNLLQMLDKNSLQKSDSILNSCKKFPNTSATVFEHVRIKSVLLLQSQRWTDAEKWVDENIEIYKNLYSEDALKVKQLYIYKSLIYLYQDFYQKSIDYSTKALSGIIPSSNIKKDVYKISTVAYSKLNNYDKSFFYAEKYLALVKQALGENHVELANAYSLIATIYREQNNLQLSIEYAKQSIEIYENQQEKVFLSPIARMHQVIVGVYLELEEYQKALFHAKEAQQIREQLFLKNRFYALAATYSNVGTVYRNLENYDSAYYYYHLSLAAEKSLPQKHWNIARIGITQNNLGYAFGKQQNYDSALFYYEKSLEFKQESKKSWSSANVLNNLGNTFAALSDFTKAREKYQTSIALNSVGEEYGDLEVAIDSYKGLADLPIFSFTERLNYYKKADEVIDKMRAQIYTDTDQLLVNKLTNEIYGNALSVCFEATKSRNVDKVVYEDAFYFAEKNRAFLLRKQTQETLLLSQMPDSLRKLDINYSALSDYYKRQVVELEENEKTQDTKLAYYNQQLLETREKHQQLKDRLAKEFKNYQNLQAPLQLVTTEDIKKNLTTGEQMIIYQWFEPYLFIQLIDKNRQLFYRIKPIEFEKLVKDYRNSLAKDESLEKFVLQSDALYKILIQPIASHIEKSQKLIIIPDAILQQIPFSTLVSTSQKESNVSYQKMEYPLLDFQISFHYSSSLWNATREKEPISYEYEFVGLAPVFEQDEQKQNLLLVSNRNNLNALPYSKQEIEQVANIFQKEGKKAVALTNQLANQKNLKSYATKTRRLHLATHSQTFTKTPFNSHIWLFGDDSVHNTSTLQKVYASDLYGMYFPNELVVLSSCRSGVGKVVEGEGVITLTRSFLNAGTKNIIFSLWQIDDLATKELMQIFYRYVAEGKTYSEALRLAKEEISKSEKFASPFYWSGILIIGD